jgi:hypothetical protein
VKSEARNPKEIRRPNEEELEAEKWRQKDKAGQRLAVSGSHNGHSVNSMGNDFSVFADQEGVKEGGE